MYTDFMNTNKNERYFFFGVLLLTVFVTGVILLPFINVIILSIAFAVVCSPLYRLFNKVFKGRVQWLSSLLTVIIFLAVLCVPLIFIGSTIFHESTTLYTKLIQGGEYTTYIDRINESLTRVVPEGIPVNVETSIQNGVRIISENVAGVFATTVQTIFALVLLIITMFYLLKDGPRFRTALVRLSPLSDGDDEKILMKLKNAINGVMRGYVLVGLIQGVMMGVGLTLFGVPNAALLGLLAGIASFIPTIGTSLVGVPVLIYLFFTGTPLQLIGFLIWSLTMVGMVDNVLNPILVGRSIKLSPVIVMFAVLGGIALLGPVGILIGPLVVSLLYTLLSIYQTEFS